MPSEPGYTFDRDSTQRIAKAVRYVEHSRPTIGEQVEHYVPIQNHQFIRVSGAGTASGGVTYYPGFVRNFTQSGGWADIHATTDCWLIHTTGATLTTTGSAVYDSRQMLSACTVSGTTRPLFATCGRPVVVDVACAGGSVTPTFGS